MRRMVSNGIRATHQSASVSEIPSREPSRDLLAKHFPTDPAGSRHSALSSFPFRHFLRT